MRQSLTKLVCIAATFGFVVSSKATTADAPASRTYESIHTRNLFGLKAPESPRMTNPPTQLPKLILSGITTILGDKRVLLKLQPIAKLGNQMGNQKNDELSLVLSEGQRENDIEVVKIDENAGSVKLINSGTAMLLTFEKDGAKLPSTPPALPSPGFPGTNVPGMTATLPPGGTLPGPTPPAHRFPGRNPRLRDQTAAASAATNAVSLMGYPYPSPTGAGPLPMTTGQVPPNLTPEEQAIVMEFDRQANQNNPNYPPLPPTSLTPDAAAAATGTQPQLQLPAKSLLPQ